MIIDKALETLEYHKIMQAVADKASFSAGKELAHEWRPSVDLQEAQEWQRETAEVIEMIQEEVVYNLRGARDVREEAINAQRGLVIEATVLLDIRHTLRRGAIVKRDMGKLKGNYPLIAELADDIEDVQALQDAIETSIDDDGSVKDSASTRLAIIRRDLKIAHDRLQSKLNSLVNSQRGQSYLQEPIVTMRSGRYVVPLKADNKGKIKGVVHDTSSSGATIFIEPLDTVELNNKWREMQLEEEKEIRRILAELTDLVGDASEQIVRTIEILGYLDFTLAKAHYALATDSVQPKMVPFRKKKDHPDHPGSTITYKQARHPLLSPVRSRAD